MDIAIRKMLPQEYPVLAEFLYLAIFQPDPSQLLPKEIIQQEALQVYIRDFGTQKDDHCLCAVKKEKIVGAVWVRVIPGFGSVDDQTPEIAISVIKEERGNGIGTMLLEAMKKLLQEKEYNQVSLSVQKQNPAAKLYLRLGYEIVKETQEEWIMILPLCSSKCFVNEKRIGKNYTE